MNWIQIPIEASCVFFRTVLLVNTKIQFVSSKGFYNSLVSSKLDILFFFLSVWGDKSNLALEMEHDIPAAYNSLHSTLGQSRKKQALPYFCYNAYPAPFCVLPSWFFFFSLYKRIKTHILKHMVLVALKQSYIVR